MSNANRNTGRTIVITLAVQRFLSASVSAVALSVMLSVILLNGCSSNPPQPDWQLNAQGAIERAIEAYLTGNTRIETQEFLRAKSEIARTGRADLLARIELMRCASQVASLVQETCAGFEKLRTDAAVPERIYADFLAGQLQAKDAPLLPPQHRAAASASNDAAMIQALENITDPLSRLVAAGVLFRESRASPKVLVLAVETASAQGWRRPLLAWLGVQLMRAEKSGDTADAERLRRRIELVRNMGMVTTPAASATP